MSGIIAWTGGSAPRPLAEISRGEFALAWRLYCEQLNTWAAFWQTAVPHDVRETFWNRARGDAHATVREADGYVIYALNAILGETDGPLPFNELRA